MKKDKYILKNQKWIKVKYSQQFQIGFPNKRQLPEDLASINREREAHTEPESEQQFKISDLNY